ncbi:MAG: serine/threonine-protein kinase [Fimbriiglobus sp.]
MAKQPDPTTADSTADWSSYCRSDSSADDPAGVRLGAALLRDQAERWRAGHRRPAEGYFVAHPEIALHPEVGPLLAANEFLIRTGRGEQPQPAEYCRRFPQWAGRFAADVAMLERYVGPSPAEVGKSPPVPVARIPGRSVWPKLPGYEVIGELGRGGMAVVYRARQVALDRPVALKVILTGAMAGAADRTPMRREAEVVAKLRHPNVVQIYDTGEHEGCVFLALEFVGGGSLDHRLRSRPLPPDEAARVVELVAAGVQAAHDAGIVHRDLKPANVLLDPDGTPKVSDFGLAKREHEAARLTGTGMTTGTPSYMAPEQVLSEADKIGPATDVYGLGGILYECLTGRPAFDGPTTLETMRQVAEDEVVPVRRLQAGVPRDLETICLKCLHKDPRKRYPTARAVADDLARFRAGEPILARPVGPAEMAWRWVRQYPVVPLLVVTFGMMTTAVAGLMGWTVYHAYQVAGHLRERELHLHGLRGTLLRLDESQARYADLATATADPGWADRYHAAEVEAEFHRTAAARLAPELVEAAGLGPTADAVSGRERQAFDLIRAGHSTEAWRLLQGNDHRRARDAYAAAVDHFADGVDAAADAELRQIRAEGFWALASATAVAGMIGVTAVAGWLVYLRNYRRGGAGGKAMAS